MFKNIIDAVTGGGDKQNHRQTVKGTVVLMKKNVLDFNDFSASLLDRLHEFLGKRVSLQLISAVNADDHGSVTFDWDNEEIGTPGAFLIRNNHHSEFYLKSLTLEDVPSHGVIHFPCNSWVYPASKYQNDRVFFSNKTYLPAETPISLLKYREEELENLRGDGKGQLQEWDRVYDYEVYNDLGNPDKGPQHARPVLGGSTEYPYPRRGRTGRAPAKSDPKYESRLNLALSLNIYVPRDERFGHLKLADFLSYALKSIVQVLKPEFESIFDKTPNEFDSFEDVLKLYEGGLEVPEGVVKVIRDNVPLEMLKEIFRTDGERFLKFPLPQVIAVDKFAWRTDEEFAREMLAGINPVMIRSLEEFPPASKLDPKVYGDQTSTITKEHIESNLEGHTINEVIIERKLFILDHHDALMPYLRRINSTSTKTYASRTLLFLQKNGTLKPLAIELSLPHPEGDQHGAISKVFVPEEKGVENSLWQLAKGYVGVVDSGYHQLISHWLHTHAVIEPFIIATNRQLSVLHPIYKLLHPHYRDTMNINALGRQILINAGGALEVTVFTSKYSMEFSSMLYKDWVFPEQALPQDLLKRGVAVKDSSCPHGLKLLIEDYPFAVDGLEIWFAIKTWVQDYCSVYYKDDESIKKDAELQSWWKELREKGHGDKKEEIWWPKMQTREELIETCTIIIWIASALHAAINFGQYPYGGYPPNRPAISSKLVPEKGTPEYDELLANPDKTYLKTFTSQFKAVLGISLVEILSRHSSDEVYLGQRDTENWTSDAEALEAFAKFGKKIEDIEEGMKRMNNDEKLRNRYGPVKMPYTLLYPSSEGGLTGRGIPNSVSI
ncbi:probable linoleate 9S-lipoxygenase 5 isoform X2 [Arachis ipaensis]|uniref:probable linoleate 9S-lipoxygenase 5 isoform X2 n=1 Tax=Arachis ipaensis TaxID=130454 RepID=UPI0007AEE9CA|nr:probable linoleate 9S-lipoxygenase 5 isoform X2 [Arachis ipaensis]